MCSLYDDKRVFAKKANAGNVDDQYLDLWLNKVVDGTLSKISRHLKRVICVPRFLARELAGSPTLFRRNFWAH